MLNLMKRIARAYAYAPEVLLSEQFTYGHVEIYRRFYNFDPLKILLAELQHGWARDCAELSRSDRLLNRKLKTYPLLVWSRELASEMNRIGDKRVYAVCSPWYLLLTNYKRQKDASAPVYSEIPGSALYFPPHSFPGVDYDFDFKTLEKRIQSYNFNSITTSLYWTDFLNPRVRNQFGSFSEVTCLGLRSNAAREIPWHDIGGRVNFLYQLHKIISEHEYIICDQFTTAAMAALTLGKKVFITKDEVNFIILTKTNGNSIFTISNEIIMREYGVKKSNSGLGYELSDNLYLLELAQRGFGFDVSIENTGALLESFLGNPSQNFSNEKTRLKTNEVLW